MSLLDTWTKLFSNFQWQNRPSTSTPLGRSKLQLLNDAIDGIDDRVLDLKGGVDDITTALDDKVDKVAGKGLSTNDYDNTAKGIVDGVTSALAGKVDKVEGKGLSENDFTDTLKDKLDGISEQANKVEITPVVTEGTTLATISIDGVDTAIKVSDIDVDDEMSPTSTNPVQNKVIYDALQNILPEETAEGNPISITDASGLSAKSCEVTMNPIQDLHGQSVPYPAGGGKNKIPLMIDSLKTLNSSATWNENVATLNNLTFTVNTDGGNNVIGISVNGTANADTNFELGSETFGAGAYVLSGCPEGGNTSTYRLFATNVGSDTGTGIVISFSESMNVSFRINIKNGTSLSNLNYYPQFCVREGEYLVFEPYSNICPISGRDSLVLNRCGKNVFNKNAKNTNNGYIANQYLNFQGYPFAPSTTPENWFVSEYINVKPNTKYTISGLATSSSNAPSICEYDSDKSFVTGYSYSNRENFTITTSSTTRFIRLSAGLGQTYWDTIQLEEGDSATSYNAYNGQTHTATFPDTVYGGKVVWKDGVVKAIIDRAIVNLGSLTWIYNTSFTNPIFYAPLPTKVNDRANTGLCSCYPVNPVNATGAQNAAELLNDDEIALSINTSSYHLFIRDETYTSAETLTEFLSGKTLTYELATPQEITLTPETIELLKGNNVLFTDGDNITLKYSADIKSYIAEQLSSLS